MFTFDDDEKMLPHKPTVLFFVGDIVLLLLEGDDLLTFVIMSEADYISSITYREKPKYKMEFKDTGSSVLSMFNHWVDLLKEQPRVEGADEPYPISVEIEGQEVSIKDNTVSIDMDFGENSCGVVSSIGTLPTTYSDSSSYSGD